GPRGPAVRLFWLSGTGAPNWVVRCVAGHFASLSVGLLMALTPIDPRKARRLPPGRTKPEAPPTGPLAAQPESIPENRSPKSSGARGGCPGSGSRTTLRLVRSTCQATRPSGELGVAAPGPILGAVVHVVVDRHLAARPLDGPRGPDVVRREVLHAGDHDLTGDVEDDLTARGRITRRPVFDHHRVDPGLRLGQPDVLGAVGARVVDVLVGVVRGISLHAPVGARADARGPGAVRGVVVDPAARLDEVQLPVSADRVPGERDADVGLDAVLGRDVHDLDGGAARVGPQELEELLTTEQGQLDGIAPFVV